VPKADEGLSSSQQWPKAILTLRMTARELYYGTTNFNRCGAIPKLTGVFVNGSPSAITVIGVSLSK
jgi:hypothetical protein